MTHANMRMAIFRSGAEREERGAPAFETRRSQSQNAIRNREILHEREGGSSLEELARKYGLQRTTVKALLIRERHRRAFALLRQQPATAV